MYGFVKRFFTRGLVHKHGFFTEKTTYFVVVNSVEEMNNEISRKHENMRAMSRSKRTWRSSVSCLSATYLVSYASFVVKQHCHKVRFCGCKQRRRNEQRNQQKTRKYACDVKKPKSVDVLRKRKATLHGLNIGWFYKLPPYIVSKFYEIRFIIFWLIFGSKWKFAQSCSSLHSFTHLHFDLKNKSKI